MRRLLSVLLSAALVAAALAGCARKVSVETGTRYVCTYGESLGSDVKRLEVPEADAGKYHVETKTITCSRHQQAEVLYLKAQQAIKAGDLKAALAALTDVLKLDPKYKSAASQASDIKAGKKPKPDTSLPPSKPTTGTTPGDAVKPPAGDDSNQAMDAYRGLVPDTLAGFTAEAISAETLYLTRAYVPSDKGRYDQLVIMVQQYQTAKAAASARDAETKSAYPASAGKVTAAGRDAYFGTNGQGFAALALVDGTVVVTFELHSTGTKPASLKADLQSIADRVL